MYGETKEWLRPSFLLAGISSAMKGILRFRMQSFVGTDVVFFFFFSKWNNTPGGMWEECGKHRMKTLAKPRYLIAVISSSRYMYLPINE